jgi:hypothetical protein
LEKYLDIISIWIERKKIMLKKGIYITLQENSSESLYMELKYPSLWKACVLFHWHCLLKHCCMCLDQKTLVVESSPNRMPGV